MKANNSTSISRRFKRVTALSAIATSLLALTAAAKDEVPTRDTSTGHAISATANPDGSQDIVSEVVGVGTHVGRFTGVVHVHVEPFDPSQYDPEIHALRIPTTFFGARTAADGDTWSFTGEGVVILPLDESFNLLPPPYAFNSTWEIVGGTGRFAGLTG